MHVHRPPTNQETRVEPTEAELQARLVEAIEQSPPAEPPRIWAGSVEDYESGRPHGRWIGTRPGAEQVAAEVRNMLQRSPHRRATGESPHWAIFAAQGFGRHQPHPDTTLAEIARRTRAICADSRAFAAWARLADGAMDHALRFADVFQGRFDSLNDWVTLQVEAAGYDALLDQRLPESLRPFLEINIDALAHDMTAAGAVFAVHDHAEGGVWVFTDPRRQRMQESLTSATEGTL